jgi:flagellar biosynthesis protein FlhA
MENDVKSRNSLLTIGVILIVLIGLIPLPGIVLDIAIGLNLAHATLILLIAVKSKKITNFSLLPTALLLSTIYGLLVYISSASSILTKGPAFDGRVIRTVAFLATTCAASRASVKLHDLKNVAETPEETPATDKKEN